MITNHKNIDCKSGKEESDLKCDDVDNDDVDHGGENDDDDKINHKISFKTSLHSIACRLGRVVFHMYHSFNSSSNPMVKQVSCSPMF